jgi:hypothetical protein
MGTIKQGILGGFSGKVGTVVGGSWKGISYMRALPKKRKDAQTEAQKNQRTKFALTVCLLKPLTGFLRTGWKLYAHGKSPFNAATSHTLTNAIIGTFPDCEIDPSKVLVSRGTLPTAVNGEATITGSNLVVSWQNNSGTDTSRANDKALVAVLNPAKSDAITITAGEKRNTGKQTLALPIDWTNDEIHTYLGFISEDGRDIANSQYLGCINLS